MSSIEKLLKAIAANPKDVRFSDLDRLCTHYFGKPRNKTMSIKHPGLETPVLISKKVKMEKTKTYQVKQVLAAIYKLKDKNNG